MNLDQAANPLPNTKFKDKELCFYNPNSSHELGHKAKVCIEETKLILKKRFPQYKYIEFITGGGTLANIRSILGSIPFKPRRLGKNEYLNKIIISGLEHKSINETVVKKLSDQGYDIIKISPDKHGVINLNLLKKVVLENKDHIALMSVMNVNNEVGTIQPISEIHNIIKETNPEIIFHSDICQGITNLYNQKTNFPDIVSFSVYKLGGPHMGIILSNNKLNEDYFGTPDTSNIILSGLIIEDYFNHMLNPETIDNIKEIKQKIKKEINDLSSKLEVEIKDLSNEDTVEHIQSFLLPEGYQSQLIQGMLSKRFKIYIGIGSACAAINFKNGGSHVIKSMGYKESFSLLRFSYLDNITDDDISELSKGLYDILSALKPLAENKVSLPQPITKAIELKNCHPIDKQYEGIDFLHNIKSIEPKFDTIRLSVGELYLKGCNKDKYMKRLINNLCDLKISKKNLLIKENIIIILNNDKEIQEFKKIPGIAKISPCCLIKRNEDDKLTLINLLELINGLMAKKVKENKIIKFRLSVNYISTNFYQNKPSQLESKIGQFIRDNFKEKVMVDLTNYDINIHLVFYRKIVLLIIDTYKGLGGLPTGSSGIAGLMISRKYNIKRINAAISMILSRGSDYKIIKDEKEIDTVNYLVIEPVYFNDNQIYDVQNQLEKKYKKPVFTLTNLIADDEFKNFNSVDFIRNHIPFNFITDDYKNLITEVNQKPIKNILMLLSGGIDSPVASHLLLRANYNVDFIHFSADIDKTDNINELKNLLNKTGRLYVVNFKPIQNEIVQKCDESYRTLLYKIFMIKIANQINHEQYEAIALGNALGQVASQTIENMTYSNLQSQLPIISPLFGYNKETIIEIARKIGSYEISIKDGTNDCCTMFMPKHPVTNSSNDRIIKNINRIDLNILDKLEIIQS